MVDRLLDNLYYGFWTIDGQQGIWSKVHAFETGENKRPLCGKESTVTYFQLTPVMAPSDEEICKTCLRILRSKCKRGR